MKDYNYLVLVNCITFNQASYIEDALNGFCMQETTFPFVCTIIDDASTDGEPEVIKKYLDCHFDLNDKETVRSEETDDYNLFFAQHKNNRNCYFAVVFLKYNHFQIKKTKYPYINEWIEGSKYYTICEGDDFWTDASRIQTMASFLESHPKYVIVTHRINKLIQATGEIKVDKEGDVYYGDKKGVTFGRYYNRFINWQTQIVRSMYNRRVFFEALKEYPYTKTDGVIGYLILKYGKGFGLNRNMATYRVNSGGIYSRKSDFEKAFGDVKMFDCFYQYEKSLFALLCYYAKYADVYMKFSQELKNQGPINKRVYLFMIIYVPFIYIKAGWFKIKKLIRR